MAAKDRYAIDVECGDCGIKGKVHLSENDYPFMSRLDRAVDKVEGEFSATIGQREKLSVKCKSCGKEVENW